MAARDIRDITVLSRPRVIPFVSEFESPPIPVFDPRIMEENLRRIIFSSVNNSYVSLESYPLKPKELNKLFPIKPSKPEKKFRNNKIPRQYNKIRNCPDKRKIKY